jgi:hypothetical protein
LTEALKRNNTLLSISFVVHLECLLCDCCRLRESDMLTLGGYLLVLHLFAEMNKSESLDRITPHDTKIRAFDGKEFDQDFEDIDNDSVMGTYGKGIRHFGWGSRPSAQVTVTGHDLTLPSDDVLVKFVSMSAAMAPKSVGSSQASASSTGVNTGPKTEMIEPPRRCVDVNWRSIEALKSVYFVMRFAREPLESLMHYRGKPDNNKLDLKGQSLLVSEVERALESTVFQAVDKLNEIESVCWVVLAVDATVCRIVS